MGNCFGTDGSQQKYEHRKLDDLNEVKGQHQNEMRKLREENARLNNGLNKYRNDKRKLEEQITRNIKEVNQLKTENEELKTRLSSALGAMVRDGNPNIADLSDMNRPTNLAESFSELYDNAWTDAYDQITNSQNLNEKDTCTLLLVIFCEIYKLCRQKADKELEQLKEVLQAFYGAQNTELRKQFKDNRKKEHASGRKNMKKVVTEEIGKLLQSKSIRQSKELSEYIDGCLGITWLMAVQDPPVFVDTNTRREGEMFDKNIFKTYTTTGPVIDFIVWPSLYLAEGENMLAKGVAQGKGTEQTRRGASHQANIGEGKRQVNPSQTESTRNAQTMNVQANIKDSSQRQTNNATSQRMTSDTTQRQPNTTPNQKMTPVDTSQRQSNTIVMQMTTSDRSQTRPATSTDRRSNPDASQRQPTKAPGQQPKVTTYPNLIQQSGTTSTQSQNVVGSNRKQIDVTRDQTSDKSRMKTSIPVRENQNRM